MRQGAFTRERLVPYAASERGEGDSDRATRAYRNEEPRSLTPQGVGGVLDSAWAIFSERFLNCVGVAFALTLPARAGMVAVRYSGMSGFHRSTLGGAVDLMAPVLIAVLVANLVSHYVHGRRSSTWESVRSTFDRWPSLIAILAILAVGSGLLGVAFVCCFPIGFYLYWVLSIAPAVYAVERRSLLAVVPRALALLRGWRSFGRFLGIMIVHALMFAGLTVSMVALDDPNIRAWLLESTALDGLTLDLLVTIPASILMAISTAFLAIMLTVYYFDVRARREGLDLELRLQELEASLSPAATEAAP